MRSALHLLSVALVTPCLALAQVEPNEWSTPPLVPAPADSPPAEATPPPPASTPPPPGATPPPPGARPQTDYPYSPYGQPTPPPAEPPLEVGLMISEAAFGMLTSAGVAVLPYLLFDRAGLFAQSDGIGDLLLVLLFSAVPLAVAQTELSLANGSQYYRSESWPASLSGLAAQAAVLGLFYFGFGGPMLSTVNSGRTVLLVGTIAFVPLVEMAVLNFTKPPRSKLPYGGFSPVGLVNYSPEGGLRAALPAPLPLAGPTRTGFFLPLASGLF
ncbi:MAG: hypothetical protein HYZ28_15720 [Myxococcales bacterium]|nr:hypothetical protein [Myxococcales bacterium]